MVKTTNPQALATSLVKRYAQDQLNDSLLPGPRVSAVVATPDQSVAPNTAAATVQCAAAVVAAAHDAAFSGVDFRPVLDRPAPLLLDCLDVESKCGVFWRVWAFVSPNPSINRTYTKHLFDPRACLCADVWMSPTESTHTVIWDTSMGIENTQGAEVRALVKKACKVSLATDLSKFVLAEINNDPKLVYHIGMTPSKVCVHLYTPTHVCARTYQGAVSRRLRGIALEPHGEVGVLGQERTLSVCVRHVLCACVTDYLAPFRLRSLSFQIWLKTTLLLQLRCSCG